jgi:ribosome maturation factor RimP
MGARRPFFVREANAMTHVHERERELHREVAARVEGAFPAVEVLAVELRGPEQLCVYVDRPEGVDHDLCVEVTGVLRDYLERYGLEVSSPGPERPLRTREHFARATGRKVALRTAHEVGGRKRFRGEVLGAGEDTVTLAGASGERLEVPYDEIVRGNLIDEGLTR